MPQALSSKDRVSGHPTREYSLTELCQEFGITARALRFYEDEGLISPQRKGLNRIYSWRDRARLVWILRGKRIGFSLSDIREMIDLYDLDDGRVTQRRKTLEKCRIRLDLLTKQKADIDVAIDELTRFMAMVEAASAEGSVEANSFETPGQASPEGGDGSLALSVDEKEMRALATDVSKAADRMANRLDQAISAVRTALDPAREEAIRTSLAAQYAGRGAAIWAGLDP